MTDDSAAAAACDRATREWAPDACALAHLPARAASLRRLAPVTARSGSYASDVVHAAFAEARKAMHAATARSDWAAARSYAYAGSICHAAADACAALGAAAQLPAGSGLLLASALRNAEEGRRMLTEFIAGDSPG